VAIHDSSACREPCKGEVMKLALENLFAMCALAITGLLLAAGSALGQEVSDGQQNSAPEDPPARVARLSYLNGSVSFLRAGVDQWSQAATNFPVTTGDRIYTEKDGRAELQVGNYTVRLSHQTDMSVTNLSDEVLQLGLQQGTLGLTVYQVTSGETVEIDTPDGVLTVKQPGTYRVDVDPGGEHTRAYVNSGSVEVTGGGTSKTVKSGQAVDLTGYDLVTFISRPSPPPDEFDKWCDDRDTRVSSSASSRYVSRSVPGFQELDAYGTWEDAPDYGAVWYPAGVAVEWVPFRFGRWIWVGPWGWTWVEDEPWGFCQFHYGRWVHIGVRWGWLPGPIVPLPIYVPAVVAFVGGPHFSVAVDAEPVSLAAWFPLGPGEPFSPWYHCREDYVRIVNVTNIRNVTNIINVTNIQNVHYAYRTVAMTAVPAHIFSSGLPVARQVVRLSRQQIEHAQVIPHPGVNPTMRAVLAGASVRPPPVRPQSLVTAAKTAPRAAPVSQRSLGVAQPRMASPRLLTRTPPPPARVPFAIERPAMMAHPGRPLEPQQLQNLRVGRTAGPMLDREFPPHVAPMPKVRTAPHQR
jgi:hypothetical protein